MKTELLYEGIEKKELFSKEEKDRLFAEIGEWFERVKEKIPPIGILIRNRYDDPELYTKNVGTPPPPALQKIFNVIIKDAIQYPESEDKKYIKIVLERTGNKFTNPDDAVYHVDTKQIYWDDQGNRIGYDPQSGPDKYMVFIHRPGTLVIKLQLDPNLDNGEQNKIASNFYIDPVTGETFARDGSKPEVLQLEPDEIYRVRVGNLIHGPPPHEDGLLITVSLITEMTKNNPIPVYLE